MNENAGCHQQAAGAGIHRRTAEVFLVDYRTFPKYMRVDVQSPELVPFD
jgi:hypothetical protein